MSATFAPSRTCRPSGAWQISQLTRACAPAASLVARSAWQPAQEAAPPWSGARAAGLLRHVVEAVRAVRAVGAGHQHRAPEPHHDDHDQQEQQGAEDVAGGFHVGSVHSGSMRSGARSSRSHPARGGRRGGSGSRASGSGARSRRSQLRPRRRRRLGLSGERLERERVSPGALGAALRRGHWRRRKVLRREQLAQSRKSCRPGLRHVGKAITNEASSAMAGMREKSLESGPFRSSSLRPVAADRDRSAIFARSE